MSDYQDNTQVAGDVAAADSPLIQAIASTETWNGDTITYGFVERGNAVDKFPDIDSGSDITLQWSEEQMAIVEAGFDNVEMVVDLTFVQVEDAPSANIEFQLVEEVGGGFAGYAQFPNNESNSFVVIGELYVEPEVSNTTIHEIGHALGLEHPHDGVNFPLVEESDDVGLHNLNNALMTTMSYNLPVDPLRPDLEIDAYEINLMALDIAALQEMYGANMNTATGDDTYGHTMYLECIWDAGGEDSIDFSEAVGDSVIDLRAATLEAAEGGGGYFSFIYDGANYTTGGYTIANGVVIEHGTGGYGDDEITGNQAANTLKGNVGADTMDGGNGRDMVKGGQNDDRVSGGNGNDTVAGEKGDDVVHGNKGKDRVKGGEGDDALKGGKGNDMLYGGTGNDTMTGGKGDDEFKFYIAEGMDEIKDFDASEDTLALEAVLVGGVKNGDTAVDRYARIDDGDAVFSFAGGGTLTLLDFAEDYKNNASALDALGDAISFI